MSDYTLYPIHRSTRYLEPVVQYAGHIILWDQDDLTAVFQIANDMIGKGGIVGVEIERNGFGTARVSIGVVGLSIDQAQAQASS